MSKQGEGTGGGFQGAMQGLPLADLLQLWSTSRFSGRVVVRSQGQVGTFYFLDGEMVHAEADHWIGERAVTVILGWPAGSFEPAPGEATQERTIHKRLSHLLLNAQRALDERQRPFTPALTPPPISLAAVRSGPSTLEKVRAVPGVALAVRFGSDGRIYPGEGAAAEALAAKALYLALNPARAIGAAFGLRDLSVGSVQGPRESFLVVQSQGSFLGVTVAPQVAFEPVADQVRHLLIRPVAR
jgi:hypothetical protein